MFYVILSLLCMSRCSARRRRGKIRDGLGRKLGRSVEGLRPTDAWGRNLTCSWE